MATKEKSLEETATWAVAVVCFVLLLISILIEYFLHFVGHWLKRKHKSTLYEALEKVKAELMLMGFISLLLTVFQSTISGICIPKDIAAAWHPCSNQLENAKYGKDYVGRKLLEDLDSNGYNLRRSLATKGYDTCNKGKVAFVSAYGIHQLHIFIFVLAVVHVVYCITIYALGTTKMKTWKNWENETKYQHSEDPETFRFARDTSFGRRHLHTWSQYSFTLWIACFFRQFYGSVTKTDYLTLRHGFIMAHLSAESATRFDFRKYIERSLEKDFKVVVGISPVIWFIAVLCILTNTHGWNSYLWLPFIPLVVILVIGTKLQVIITKLGLRILHKGDVVKGAPVVEPGDHLFWFGRPDLILFLINLVLFTNAFQLAFFIWSTYEFGLKNCFHKKTEDIVIRIVVGVTIHILCSYITLPLYALVTQMGTTMRPTIFNENVASALKTWHHTAKKHTKHGHSELHTPFSSRPMTPTHSMSPVNLLHNNPQRSNLDPEKSLSPSHSPPRFSDLSTRGNHHNHFLDPESLRLSHHNEISESDNRQSDVASPSEREGFKKVRSVGESVNIQLSEFTFNK